MPLCCGDEEETVIEQIEQADRVLLQKILLGSSSSEQRLKQSLIVAELIKEPRTAGFQTLQDPLELHEADGGAEEG